MEKRNAVIIDEAHNFISTVESVLTKIFSEIEVKNRLKKIKDLLTDGEFLKLLAKQDDSYLNSLEEVKDKLPIFESENTLFFKKPYKTPTA